MKTDVKDFRFSIIKALLPHIILSLLQEQPMHGYAVIKTIKTRYRPAYFGPSTIYPLLEDLTRDGLVRKCSWITDTPRPHIPYEITGKGQAWLAQTKTAFEAENIIELKAHV